jgi:hypothetical protein
MRSVLLHEPIIPIVVVVSGLVIFLAVWAGRRWIRRSSEATSTGGYSLPPKISLHSQPLMTKAEAMFYNVLRLAVQDHYFVFPQIPLWCVVDVTSIDARARQAFFTQIALKRLGYVLVHPGTLTAVTVVELEEESPSSHRQARNRLVEDIVKTAGIELIRIPAQPSYTVSEIAGLLNLEPAR